MDNSLLCLLVSLTLWSCAMTITVPRPDFPAHVKRLITSDDVDGYDVATVYAFEDDEEVGQTKRDLELHASDSTSAKKHFTLRMVSSGEELRMSLTRRRHVDTSGIRFHEITDNGKREITDVQVRDCFFDGPLSDGQGHAHMAICDGNLMGTISTNSRRLYQILPLPEITNKRSAEDDVTRVLLTWKDNGKDAMLGELEAFVKRQEDDGIKIDDDEEGEEPEQDSQASKVKRGTAVKVEIGNYLDKYYIADCNSNLGLSSDQQLIDLQILKFSSAASILWTTKISWDITLKLADVTLMKTNPTWYGASSGDTIGDRMNFICQGTMAESYDQVTLSTSQTSDLNRLGLSWIQTVCRARYRCSASRAVNTNYHTELHELGHNLGLNHDELMPECDTDPEKPGFMSTNRDWFRSCYKNRLDSTFSNSMFACVFTNNVSGNVGTWNGK